MTKEDLEIARKIIQLESKIEMIDTDLQRKNLMICHKIRNIIVPINYCVSEEILYEVLNKEKERLQNTIKYLMGENK